MAEPRKSKETDKFSITLSTEALEMLDSLCFVGLYGKKRATVAAHLIMDQLKIPAVEARVEKGRLRSKEKSEGF